MFASSLLAVVGVFVEREPIGARTHVRTNGVFADVLAPSVVDGTLVLVCVGVETGLVSALRGLKGLILYVVRFISQGRKSGEVMGG